MSTTIDKLQIEIESSSGNAAKGIDDLAKSLAALKKSGTISVAVKNLNNLSDALNRLQNVHPASNALRTLANSIEKLKGAGSLSGLVTSLGKLPGALKSLGSINLDRVAPRISAVANAMAPLSSVKAGGFGTLVNSLKKLDDVTKNLDDDTITRFAAKVELLNQKLGPLSQKMTSIKAGFGAINSAARSTTVSIGKLADEVNVTTLNFANMVTSAQGIVAALQPLIDLLVTAIGDAMEWDGIRYQFGNAFGEQADEYYEKITKITDALYINKQAFMENSAMATSMLVGFGVDKADAREMGVGYTQLAYDIWSAYNNVYKTFDGADGAMAAVRSAIAGEVEPIRRAGFTIVDSQLAITAANHGLAYSTTEATEAQKSYLRYLTLVDKAQEKGIVGTYAREMNTAEGMTRQLTQQMKSLSQAFGSLFLPILVKILPYIQAFVDLLTDGVRWLAALFGVEIQDIGDTWNDYSTGVGDAVTNTDGVTDSIKEATKAAKELKNASIGIDELNVISPPSASSGAGGAGGGAGGADGGYSGVDVSSLWDDSIFDGIQQDVDRIKEKMEGWLPVVGVVATALAGLRLNKLLKDIQAIEKTKLFAGKIKGFAGFVTAFAQLAKEGGIIATLAVAFPKLSKAIAGFVGNFGAFMALAKEGGVIPALAAAFPKLSTAISGVVTALAGITAPVWAGIAAAILAVGSAVYFLVKNWDEFKQAVKDFFAENIAPKFDEIRKHFEKIGEAFGPLKVGFDAIGDFVKNIPWDKVGSAVGKFFEALGALVLFLSTGALPAVIQTIVGVFENLIQILSGTIQQVRGWIDVIVGIFTLDGDKIKVGAKKIVDGVVESFKGLIGLPIDIVKDMFTGIVDWFTKLWDILVGHSIVPDTINAIVKWFTSLPSKIFGSIEKFATGIVDKFKGMWSKLVTWWNGKTKLKEYTPNIGSIYDKVKSRWDSARTWWNDKKSKMKEYTPSIGSIYEKVYTRWKNARDWWNSKKGSFKTYTPSIGSLTDKVKSAWNSAKKWWNNNVKLSTKLDIKVPKLTVNWGEVSALGKTFKYPKSFSVKFAAEGGIFDQGSLIWAGERGPEVMATAAGGRTGVMNVQQMQDAVCEGVYAAVIAAMRGNTEGGQQSVNVYLDGRQITAAVEKRQRERGASIMGNEVYSY